MALPTNIKNAIDNLYDELQASETGVVYRKVTVLSKDFKVRITKRTIDGKLEFIVEIKER